MKLIQRALCRFPGLHFLSGGILIAAGIDFKIKTAPGEHTLTCDFINGRFFFMTKMFM